MRKRLICGVGIVGDEKCYDPKTGENFKSYDIWVNIIHRCYNMKLLLKFPEYRGCYVAEEWLYYPNFKAWFDENYCEDGYLSKDLINKDNKVYSKETCVFIPQEINYLVSNHFTSKNGLPIGISFNTELNKYVAQMRKRRKIVRLGSHTTVEEAYQAYKKAKESYIKEVAEEYYQKGLLTQPAYEALLRYEISVND